jgi:hypothetical protein
MIPRAPKACKYSSKWGSWPLTISLASPSELTSSSAVTKLAIDYLFAPPPWLPVTTEPTTLM